MDELFQAGYMVVNGNSDWEDGGISFYKTEKFNSVVIHMAEDEQNNRNFCQKGSEIS